MKYFVTILVLVSVMCINNAKSENPIRVGGELGVQLPVGDFGDGASAGFGISGIFHYYLQPQLILGGTIGYQSWGGEVDGFSWSNIPIMALINYQFNTDGLIPFVGAELGLNSFGASYEFDFFGQTQSGSTSEMYFGINLLGGIESKLNENMSWRVNAKYNIIMGDETLSFLGINAGVMYHLK